MTDPEHDPAQPNAGSDAGAQDSPRPGKSGPLASAAASLAGSVGGLASGARRRLDEHGRGRKRNSRDDPSQPLKLLFDVHPEARRAAPREVGLKIVPIDSILGTAVEGPAQRGADFLPLRPRRGADWEARFQRIQNALERLDTLPPVELLRFGDGYWVLDGHNRVGAGLRIGQVAVDANVTDLRMPGSRATATRIAPYLEGSGDLRAAGTGRRRSTSLGRESVEPDRLAAERRAFHAAEEDDATSERARAAPDNDASATPVEREEPG